MIFFGRDTALYPGGDLLSYVARAGGTGVALLGASRSHRDLLGAAVERFGAENTYIWDSPGSWRPSTWRATVARDLALCLEHGVGLIPDPEHAAEWVGAGDTERTAFASTALIEPAAADVRVRIYTFHGHPSWRAWASQCSDAGARVGGLVSMYGAAHGVPRANYAGVLAEWVRRWPAGASPAIALGDTSWPGMDPPQYAAYLADVAHAATPASLAGTLVFGRAPPLASTYVDALRSWMAAISGAAAVRGLVAGATAGEPADASPLVATADHDGVELGLGPWVPWLVGRS